MRFNWTGFLSSSLLSQIRTTKNWKQVKIVQSDNDMSGGAQANQMLQIDERADMERTLMSMQLDQFKQELHGATSSVSSEVKKIKTD